ncbi:MAG TPA: ABC transporter ATP-binding protein [Firmicutes bacterium]|nr:ABC transporter ATP-binding protein [Bacillota bacterium]
MLQLNNVSHSYDKGKTWAVRDLSLNAKQGEIFGFLGPNGAGKTTTLRMIVGLLPPTSGNILVTDIDVWKNPTAAKKVISFLPDNPNVYERLTGWEYIRFMADIYGVSQEEREQRAERLLTQFEMLHAAPDLISSYSHGMRQKIALTAALIHDPKIIILDEPMVGLDPRSAAILKQLLREHCDRGATVFFSTHILDVAERLCDRVGIINKGYLIAQGTLEELRQGQRTDATLEALFLELTQA